MEKNILSRVKNLEDVVFYVKAQTESKQNLNDEVLNYLNYNQHTPQHDQTELDLSAILARPNQETPLFDVNAFPSYVSTIEVLRQDATNQIMPGPLPTIPETNSYAYESQNLKHQVTSETSFKPQPFGTYNTTVQSVPRNFMETPKNGPKRFKLDEGLSYPLENNYFEQPNQFVPGQVIYTSETLPADSHRLPSEVGHNILSEVNLPSKPELPPIAIQTDNKYSAGHKEPETALNTQTHNSPNRLEAVAQNNRQNIIEELPEANSQSVLMSDSVVVPDDPNQPEVEFNVDENGILIDQNGQPILDDNGQVIKLNEEEFRALTQN